MSEEKKEKAEFAPAYSPNPQAISTLTEALAGLIEFEDASPLEELAEELLERLWKAGWVLGWDGGYGRRSVGH